MPDHVHKSGGHGGDQVQVGQWVDGKKGPEGTGTVGTWTTTPGSTSVLLDKGKTHASKDFYDPIKKRQIMWVWGTVTSGIQTIPRDMTYHPGIKQIVYTPVAEMSDLHTKVLDKAENVTLPHTMTVSGSSHTALSFAIPKVATSISAKLGTTAAVFSFTPAPASASAAMVPWQCTVSWVDGGKQLFSDAVPLLADDGAILLDVYSDGSVAELYWMNGRVAMTVPIDPGAVEIGLTSTVAGGAVLTRGTSYQMGDIHTTADDVLAAPRQYPAA